MTPLRKRLWIYGVLLSFLVMAWAVLAPIFAAARDKSRPVSCLSHIKQLATGMLMYSVDYDDALPPAQAWATVTEPHVKSRDAWKCPSAATPYGYGFNASLDRVDTVGIGQPFDLALLFEADAVRPDTHGGPERVTQQERHMDGLNWAYADGHARFLKRGTPVRWRP